MTAVGKKATLRGIKDAKFAVLSTDNTSATTYGTLYDIPDVASIPLTFKVEADKQKGDGRITDIYAEIQEAEGKMTFGRVCMDVLSLITGGSITASGITPNQKQTLKLGNTILPYFKLEGQCKYVGTNGDTSVTTPADAHFLIKKGKITSDLEVNFTNDGFANISFGFTAIQTVYGGDTSEIVNIVFNETSTAIT